MLEDIYAALILLAEKSSYAVKFSRLHLSLFIFYDFLFGLEDVKPCSPFQFLWRNRDADR